MGYKATKDLHEIEVKVRLTEKQAKILEALADFYDVPKAVIARKLIHQGMSEPAFGESNVNRLSA